MAHDNTSGRQHCPECGSFLRNSDDPALPPTHVNKVCPSGTCHMDLVVEAVQVREAQEAEEEDAGTALAEEIKLKWTGDARRKMSSRGIMPAYEDGADWAETAREVEQEYSSIIKLRTREDVRHFLTGLQRVRHREPQTCTWMTGAHSRAYDRVYSEVLDAVKAQGVEIDASGLGAADLTWPDEGEDEEEIMEEMAEVAEAMGQPEQEAFEEYKQEQQDGEDEDDQRTASDLLLETPADRHGTLQMTDKQTAVIEAAMEAPQRTPERVAEEAEVTTRYAETTMERWEGTEAQLEALAQPVPTLWHDVAENVTGE